MYWEVKNELSNTDNINIINAFLTDLKRKDRSKQTITRFRGILQQFFFTFTQSWNTITRKDIEEWLKEQQRLGKKEKTVSNYLTVIRLFYRFCVLENHTETTPFQDTGESISTTERYWELKRILPNQENQAAINTFLCRLKQVGRSKITIINIRMNLQNFFMQHEKSFQSITLDDIEDWITKNQSTGKKTRINAIRSSLRSFYEYCWELDTVKTPPIRSKRQFFNCSEDGLKIQVRLPNAENKVIINEFLDYLRKMDRRSRTIEDYRICLQSFFKSTETHFSLITLSDIQHWIENSGLEKKSKTKKFNMDILRSFYLFCVREKYLGVSPIKYKWEQEKTNQKYWKVRKPFANEENKEMINEFLLTMKIINMSEATICQYKYNLERFFENRKEDYSVISQNTFLEWLKDQQTEVKQSTIRTRLTILSSFYTFCKEEGYIEKNPIKRRWYPRLPKSVPKYLEKAEIAQVRRQCETEKLRDRVIVEFFLSSGCRISELYKLDKEDLELDNRTARVKGKGKKIREVHFSETCSILLERYLNSRKDTLPMLFVSERVNRLGIRGIYDVVKKIGKDVDMEGSLYPHRLRHTFATELLVKGADLSFIADELGHVNLETTTIYAKLPKTKLVSLYRKFMG